MQLKQHDKSQPLCKYSRIQHGWLLMMQRVNMRAAYNGTLLVAVPWRERRQALGWERAGRGTEGETT